MEEKQTKKWRLLFIASLAISILSFIAFNLAMAMRDKYLYGYDDPTSEYLFEYYYKFFLVIGILLSLVSVIVGIKENFLAVKSKNLFRLVSSLLGILFCTIVLLWVIFGSIVALAPPRGV